MGSLSLKTRFALILASVGIVITIIVALVGVLTPDASTSPEDQPRHHDPEFIAWLAALEQDGGPDGINDTHAAKLNIILSALRINPSTSWSISTKLIKCGGEIASHVYAIPNMTPYVVCVISVELYRAYSFFYTSMGQSQPIPRDIIRPSSRCLTTPRSFTNMRRVPGFKMRPSQDGDVIDGMSIPPVSIRRAHWVSELGEMCLWIGMLTGDIYASIDTDHGTELLDRKCPKCRLYQIFSAVHSYGDLYMLGSLRGDPGTVYFFWSTDDDCELYRIIYNAPIHSHLIQVLVATRPAVITLVLDPSGPYIQIDSVHLFLPEVILDLVGVINDDTPNDVTFNAEFWEARYQVTITVCANPKNECARWAIGGYPRDSNLFVHSLMQWLAGHDISGYFDVPWLGRSSSLH